MTMTSSLTTAPATLAGNLAVGNAEVISAAALMQLAFPGSPFFYAAAQTASDPRTGAYTGGGPEDFLFGAATNKLSDYYNMPLSMGSFATGAKWPNWQAGVENSLSTFMASVVMSDMLLGAGLLHGSRIFSFEQLMMDCEIFDIVYNMMQGIVVNEETLALDAVHDVGPGGNYLAQKHSRRHMRDLWLPKYFDRRTYEEWEQKQDDGRDWAREKAKQVLETHEPAPLEPQVSKEFARIIRSVEEKS
jgi:trimethylamine--corrinoid protein Co-methyltransferase